MIFLTVGSRRFPFDRLVRGVDPMGGKRGPPLFGQIGASLYEPRNFPWVRYLPYREMDERIHALPLCDLSAAWEPSSRPSPTGRASWPLPGRADGAFGQPSEGAS